jgi:uncharacterized membrane protein (DUF106 family)
MGAIYPALSIIFICIVATFVIEFISWVLVYRKKEFAPLQNDIKMLNKKLNLLQEQPEEKKTKKEIGIIKNKIRSATTKLNGLRFKTTFIMPFVLMAIFGILGQYYDGIIVAKLPFEPFGFIRGMTSRGLEGIKEDNFDCSFLPIYILGNMGIKPLITKLLGFAPPRSAGGMSPWEQATARAESFQEKIK